MTMPRLSMYSKTAIDPATLERIRASAAESSDDDEAASNSDSDIESDDYASTEFGPQSDENHDEDDKKDHKELAKGETRAIQRLRVIFALVIVACTVLVAVGVYLYTSGTEQKAFQEAFSTDANKVLEAIGTRKK